MQLASAGHGAVAHSPSLNAAAIASVRPRECSSVVGVWGPLSGGTNVWAAARDPRLVDYCELLARGFGQLNLSPKAAQATADLADAASPGHAGPWVLKGRALVLGGAYGEAHAAFARALAQDPRSLEEPATMRAWAQALAHSDRPVEALAVYRALGPRLALLPTLEERGRVFIEGAELAFSLGPSSLDDGIAFLAEARRLGVREQEWRVGSELALALDRAGRSSEAQSLAVDLTRRFRVAPKGANLPGEQETAATAFVLETSDPRGASSLWEKYLSAPHPAFAEHAQLRLDALRKKRR